MKTAPAAPTAAIDDEVDELGALEKEVLPFRPKLARIEVLRKAIRARYDPLPAAAQAQPQGKKFFAVIGPRGFERHLNPQKLIKAIGLKLYASFSTMTLRTLEENVEPAIVAGVVTVEQTGPRTVNTFAKVA
jgi:hypothetical protein